MPKTLLLHFRCPNIRKLIHYMILHYYIANIQSDADENEIVDDGHQQGVSHSRVKFLIIQECPV